MSLSRFGKVGDRRDLEKSFPLPDIILPPEAAVPLRPISASRMPMRGWANLKSE
jgi:hypothetical protein